MTTEQLLDAIHKAKKRDDVVRFYAHGLKVENREFVEWGRVNAAIRLRWSRSSLNYIKEQAWNMYYAVLR